MMLSSLGSHLLKNIEKLMLLPYDDQTGKKTSIWCKGATIGYGHLISSTDWTKYKDGITKEQADELFLQDLQPYVDAVEDNVKITLTQNQTDALIILTFNIGINGFIHSSALKLINDPSAKTNFNSLESAWKSWNKSQGKVNSGLMKRRMCEWDIYSKNVYNLW